AHGTVSVNALGALDFLQAAISGLKPRQKCTLWLVDSRLAPFGRKEALVNFQANVSGAQIAQPIAPVRNQLNSVDESREGQRFLMIADTDSDAPVLIQASTKGRN